MIDKDKVGLIIGKAGKNIKWFKEKSGAKIFIKTENVKEPYAKLTGNKD